MKMDNKDFGYFDDDNREFVITEPMTPFPWINYLGNEDFLGLISNTAGGYAFYKDAKFRRITRYRYNGVPMDDGGRYFYIKDGDTVWNPGWKPCRTPLDFYECRHGLSYTRITGVKDGVKASVLFFVPVAVHAEVHRLTLTNTTEEVKNLKVYSFVEWCLWNAATDMENFQRNLSTGEVEVDGSVIYHKTEYKERRDHYAYYGVNVPVDGFDTDRETFFGMYNGFDCPQAVTEGVSGNSIAHGWSPVASHRIDVKLQPGETKDLVFVLGYAENAADRKWDVNPREGIQTSLGARDHHIINKEKAKAVLDRFSTAEAVEEAFGELRGMWDDLLSRYAVESGEKRLDRMVNIWNQYQCMVTFNLSRSASYFESGIGRGMGFRDSNQDLVGFVHLVPERARQRIIDIASTQFPDGGCYHQYQPLTKRGNNDIGGGFNDDPMWLIFGTVAYVKETGDFSILDEMVPFDNVEGSEVTLLEHLRISFNHVVTNLGPHGLPLIGRADWNDCLNLNCFSDSPNESFQTTENRTEGSKAESLMIAGLFVYCGKEYLELLENCARRLDGMAERGAFEGKYGMKDAEDAIREMEKAVRDYGWDGEWYLRAYDFYGNKVGSRENEEGRIFIESQGWCAMAGIGKEEAMPERALDAVKKYLDCEHGMVLNYPAYTRYHIELGEQSTYPAGYKENGGIFCHNNPWVIIAETLCGRGNDAWEHYTKIAPSWVKDQTLHRTEPYIYCQCLAGKESARPGEGKNSWLTGTAAWNWLTVSQHILGIRPTFDGIIVDPCIPADMKGFTVQRKIRGGEYTFIISNPEGKQKADKPMFVPYKVGKQVIEMEM